MYLVLIIINDSSAVIYNYKFQLAIKNGRDKESNVPNT